MKKMCERFSKDPHYFIATVFRLAFALLFILVAIKKFRMGYGNFVESMVTADTLLAKEIPDVFLMIYAYLLPLAELLAGVLLLFNKYTKEAYQLIALMYLTFILGQQYDGNTAKVGTEYLPSLVALAVAYWTHHKVAAGK